MDRSIVNIVTTDGGDGLSFEADQRTGHMGVVDSIPSVNRGLFLNYLLIDLFMKKT